MERVSLTSTYVGFKSPGNILGKILRHGNVTACSCKGKILWGEKTADHRVWWGRNKFFYVKRWVRSSSGMLNFALCIFLPLCQVKELKVGCRVWKFKNLLIYHSALQVSIPGSNAWERTLQIAECGGAETNTAWEGQIFLVRHFV